MATKRMALMYRRRSEMEKQVNYYEKIVFLYMGKLRKHRKKLQAYNKKIEKELDSALNKPVETKRVLEV